MRKAILVLGIFLTLTLVAQTCFAGMIGKKAPPTGRSIYKKSKGTLPPPPVVTTTTTTGAQPMGTTGTRTTTGGMKRY